MLLYEDVLGVIFPDVPGKEMCVGDSLWKRRFLDRVFNRISSQTLSFDLRILGICISDSICGQSNMAVVW